MREAAALRAPKREGGPERAGGPPFGVAEVPLANRATIGNMSPEFGSTCAIFPIDEETISYLELTGRDKETIERVEAYAKAQGMWLEQDAPEAEYSEYLELDLSTVVPSIAGPKRPQDRILLSESKQTFRNQLPDYNDAGNETFEPVRAEKVETVSYNESWPGNGESAAEGAEGRAGAGLHLGQGHLLLRCPDGAYRGGTYRGHLHHAGDPLQGARQGRRRLRAVA